MSYLECDRPALTPEMIDAGAEILWAYDLGGDLAADVAREVFEAIWAARALPPAQDRQESLPHPR